MKEDDGLFDFAVFLILIIFLFFVIPQINGLFVGDEIEFIRAAKGIVNHGVPVFDSGEKFEYGLWHPTLYLNILAISIKFFGVHEWNTRLISVLFTLFTAAIVYLMGKHVALSNKKILLALIIFLFNPLTVQGSLLIDIDNSILMFSFAFFIYAYLKLKKGLLDLISLGILFAILLWAKLPTPPILIFAILVYNLIFNKNNKLRSILETGMIALIGIFVFLITWFLYCSYFELPFQAPFSHNMSYLNLGQDSLHFILTHLWGFKIFLFWTTPFFAILILIYGVDLIKRLKTGKIDEVDFLFLVGSVIFVEYLVIGSYQTQDFPRYFSPIVPLFSICFADYFGKKFESIKSEIKDIKKDFIIPILVASIAILAYCQTILKDPILLDRIIFDSSSVSEIIRQTVFISILYLIPLPVSYVILKKMRTKEAFKTSVLASLLICSLYLNIVHVKADFSTRYFYGEKGMNETISYLSEKVSQDDTVITRGDVAYYLHAKYYRFPLTLQKLKEVVPKGVKYIVLDKKGFFTTVQYQEVIDFIDKNYTLVFSSGDFKVYKT